MRHRLHATNTALSWDDLRPFTRLRELDVQCRSLGSPGSRVSKHLDSAAALPELDTLRLTASSKTQMQANDPDLAASLAK
jgi:hypothetical protein